MDGTPTLSHPLPSYSDDYQASALADMEDPDWAFVDDEWDTILHAMTLAEAAERRFDLQPTEVIDGADAARGEVTSAGRLWRSREVRRLRFLRPLAGLDEDLTEVARIAALN